MPPLFFEAPPGVAADRLGLPHACPRSAVGDAGAEVRRHTACGARFRRTLALRLSRALDLGEVAVGPRVAPSIASTN